MKLSELFTAETIVLGLEPRGKEDLLKCILQEFGTRKMLADLELALSDVIEREQVMSTGIGNGVAIPHAYTDGVDRLIAGFFRTTEGVEFDGLDGQAVDLFFIILGPKVSRRDHIKVLAKISRLLNHSEFREALRKAADSGDVLDVFKRFGDR